MPDSPGGGLLRAAESHVGEAGIGEGVEANRGADEEGRLGERDREGIRRLREHLPAAASYAEVPAFDRDVHDLGALAEVSTYLLGEAAA